jgi:putative transposase
MKKFAYVDREKAAYPVRTLCRVLGVSTSGYWAWSGRQPSQQEQWDAHLGGLIKRYHKASKGTYGAPRIHADLADAGIRCSRKRVSRLMRAAGLQGCHRRRRFHLTRQDPLAEPSPDRVSRQFTAMLPNRLWVADITYVPTREGFLYLAMVLDVYSRMIVGWSMSDRIDSQLVATALDMAVTKRKPGVGIIHHSDRGVQYTSIAFGSYCHRHGITKSMGATGDCYDNAMAESFFATLECELIKRQKFRTRNEARSEIFDYIEGFYNRRRRHSALGYQSPAEYERRHAIDRNVMLQSVH